MSPLAKLRHAAAGAFDGAVPVQFVILQVAGHEIVEGQRNGRGGLSVVGIYAVAAHGVTLQTHEIGVRMALGAPSSFVVRMIVRTALLQVAIDFIADIGCTVLWKHLFSSGHPDVGGRSAFADDGGGHADPFTCVACAVPARRVTHVDPLLAIHHE